MAANPLDVFTGATEMTDRIEAAAPSDYADLKAAARDTIQNLQYEAVELAAIDEMERLIAAVEALEAERDHHKGVAEVACRDAFNKHERAEAAEAERDVLQARVTELERASVAKQSDNV